MYRKLQVIFLFCLMPLIFANAEIVEEVGSLEGFVLGECPNCAYDNFVSHISEGIAREGYNHYGPEFLDPQTTGFGNYTIIEEGEFGDSILFVWEQIFGYCVTEDWVNAEALLALHDSLFNYELVHFIDGAAEYYLVRERLDSSFFDDNVDSIAVDDVVGSFQNGWGLYVFRVDAARDRIIVQMPHPNDDFLSVPVGLRFYTELDARLLMIAGAGREVAWDTTNPPYNNSKSLSDPSRNERTVFQVCHEVCFNAFHNSPSYPSVTFQVHSYDTDAHASLKDIQMSVFRYDDKPNLPVRDRAEHKDLVHFMGEYPVTGLAIFPDLDVRVDAYLGLYSNPPYAYYDTEPPITLMSTQDLSGWGGNKQAQVCHQNHDIYVDPENFIHIELDEFPDSLEPRMDWEGFLPKPMPATMTTFEKTLAYYGPLITATDSALTYNEMHPDTFHPDSTCIVTVLQTGPESVSLFWNPQAKDRNFETYWIFYDTTDITYSSPSISKNENSELWDFEVTETTIEGLDENLLPSYRFSIAGEDIFGQIAPLSTPAEIIQEALELTIGLVNTDSIRLFWKRLPGDLFYSVYTSTDAMGPFELLTITDAIEVTIPIDDEPKVFFQVRRILPP